VGDPYLSEIRIVSFGYPPRGWALCNGQLLAINQNQALFSLLGTTYGGNGSTNFALPNLQGRVPLHFGGGFIQGQQGGEQAHTLIPAEMPAHTHLLSAGTGDGTQITPGGAMFARTPANPYAPPSNLATMSPGTVSNVGGSQAHENMQPFLTLHFCIALQGIFPSRD
jgi:microcystin-dependent protein